MGVDENQKLVIASNRLPVSVKKAEDGSLQFNESSGGLATGLSSVSSQYNGVWIGWPGIAAEELTAQDKRAVRTELKKRGCYPVFLTREQVDNYYAGYSNETVWPLFHYTYDRSEHNALHWETYREVNELFALSLIHI